jgi:hypothetical protein
MTVTVILPLVTKSRLVLSQRLCQGNMHERNLTHETKIRVYNPLCPKVNSRGASSYEWITGGSC